ncbi:MAG: hypothetical protein KF745_06215 [Phycisphaeraceae bacterium]|nr:hypothetical protein [Phycisphaeraceae bacterium]
MSPREGYAVWFEPADGADTGGAAGGDAPDLDSPEEGGLAADWEEWPDRYVLDIAISATRVESLSRALFAMMPGRISPILDFLGHDAYREIDPYVSYDLIGQERFIDALRRYRAFFFEDGLVGFGALSEEPFIYVFVDEHKLITVRVESALKEKVESLLAAFDLQPVDEISGADAVTHEHRGVLDAPEDRTDLLIAEEIVEELVDEWALVLNVDAYRNVDADGHELGITPWRCIVRWDRSGDTPDETPITRNRGQSDRPSETEGDPEEDDEESWAADPPGDHPEVSVPAPPARRAVGKSWNGPERLYAEVLVTAGSLAAADNLALTRLREMLDDDVAPDGTEVVVVADRLTESDGRSATTDTQWSTPGPVRMPRTSRPPLPRREPRKATQPAFDLKVEQVLRSRWL